MVQGWLLYHENYTKKQLEQNKYSACDAYFDDGGIENYYAYSAADSAYTRAGSDPAYTGFRVESYINYYFERTGENKQDYIDAINKDNKQ